MNRTKIKKIIIKISHIMNRCWRARPRSKKRRLWRYTKTKSGRLKIIPHLKYVSWRINWTISGINTTTRSITIWNSKNSSNSKRRWKQRSTSPKWIQKTKLFKTWRMNERSCTAKSADKLNCSKANLEVKRQVYCAR